jgi:photosynthetic reaction center cytochrome c subunit
MQSPSGYRTPPVLIGLGVGAAVIAVGLALTYEAPPIRTSQTGFRGLAMVDVQHPRRMADRIAANRVPEPRPYSRPAKRLPSSTRTSLSWATSTSNSSTA